MEYKEFTLKNGLKVALKKRPVETALVGLKAKIGSFHEKKGEEGLVHFLEHCLANSGSDKYSLEEANKLTRNLGLFNAETNIEYTLFTAGMLGEDVKLYLDFISDLIASPQLEDKIFEKEKERVLREIGAYKSNPMFRDLIATKKAFYRGHPLSGSPLGKEKIVKSANADKLRELHTRGYSSDNIDLVLAGKLPNNIENLVRQYFEKIPCRNGSLEELPFLKPLEKKAIIHFSAPDLYNHDHPEESNAYINLSLFSVPMQHEDTPAISIMSGILGGGRDSLLQKALSLEEGLTYHVGCVVNGERNAGIISIETSVPSLRQEEAIEKIFEVTQGLREKEISNERLEELKKDSKFYFAVKFDSNTGWGNSLFDKMELGWEPLHVYSKINSVTPKKVLEVARKYLPESREDGKYVLLIRDPLKK